MLTKLHIVPTSLKPRMHQNDLKSFIVSGVIKPKLHSIYIFVSIYLW